MCGWGADNITIKKSCGCAVHMTWSTVVFFKKNLKHEREYSQH